MGQRGFTLIEILATVAIVSILVSIAAVNYTPARQQAGVRAAQGAMESARGAAGICIFRGSEISQPVPGVSVCGGSERWPDIAAIAGAWRYTDTFTSEAINREFEFEAESEDRSVRITCTQTGCSQP